MDTEPKRKMLIHFPIDDDRIRPIEEAFRYLLRSKLNTSQALEKMRETLAASEDVSELIRFIESAERGLTK